MNTADQPIAGPSRASAPALIAQKAKPTRKTRSAHPDQPRHPKRSRPPPLPAPPAHPSRPGGTTTTHPHLPIKVLQGAAARRTDSTKRGFGKEVIFVTRKTGLGALMGRCRSLVVDEGYTHLVLHSLGAAIPHSLLLLHAVLDTLPYPRGPRGLWYEIQTGTEECVDHIEPEDPARPIAKLPKRGKKEKAKTGDNVAGPEEPGEGTAGEEKADFIMPDAAEASKADAIPLWLAGLGSVEAAAPIRKVRLTSSMKIDIYIGPKPSLTPTAPAKQPKQSKPGEGRSRPNEQRRQALAQRREAEKPSVEKGDDAVVDEEDMLNATQEEEIEEIENR